MTEADHGQTGFEAPEDGRVRPKVKVLEQIGPDTQKVLLPDGMEVHRLTPLTTLNKILQNVEEWRNGAHSNGSKPDLEFQEST